MERKFEFKPDFKAMTIETLSKMSFSTVHGIVNLIKRDGNIYTESEANAIVGFLGEMSYRDVAHIFEAMPQLVKEVTPEAEGPQSEAPAVEEPVAEKA